MHRSGTSCLTGLLETCGLWTGVVERAARYNAKGNLEAPAVRAVNDQILSQFGGTWNKPPPMIHCQEVEMRPLLDALRPFREHDRWLIKDPRMLLTLDAWLPLIPNHHLIGTFRHPESVAESLVKRGRLAVPEHDGRQLWIHYNRILVNLHREQQFPIINFNLHEDDYRRRFQHLCRVLGLPFDSVRVNAFYERSLVSHHNAGADGLDGESGELYGYLLQHQLREGDDCAGGALAGDH